VLFGVMKALGISHDFCPSFANCLVTSKLI